MRRYIQSIYSIFSASQIYLEENYLCCVFFYKFCQISTFHSTFLFIILVLRKRVAICPSTLYPKVYRYIRSKLRFTKGETEVRKYCAISEFLTSYPNYTAFYQLKMRQRFEKMRSHLSQHAIL